ncbi:FAD-dependent oxidoreductase [Castellaniella sp.]|uniref:FAD-dependent oxidoreductase n=1 Tax=Castellaniella sp. TaxID=1955812 RepID=UPI00356018DF
MQNHKKPSSHEAGFSHLLSPLHLRGARLPNRVIMGAMHTRLETLERAPERIHAFYRERALGEVGMIITGGVAPNEAGRMEVDAPVMGTASARQWHRAIIDAVSGTATLMCLQILHAGRYARGPGSVAPSAIQSRISRQMPRMLTTAEVWQTIDDYARAAAMARDLGYHAVEIMGSEGYLINQFTAPVTNQREDEFGGSFEARVRFPLEILKAVRARVGADFPIMYRISAVDLVDGGMSGDETLAFARLLDRSGCDILNTGIGWHESTVPTIAHSVPRAAWRYATARIKQVVDMPVAASNRINDPHLAEQLLADGSADLVSMARPLLADPEFVQKARQGRTRSINTCIACNQACLDRIFSADTASCLVNPRAGHELELQMAAPARAKRIAVIGAGAAGISFAFNAAQRGHQVALYEASDRIGGQLLMARNIPGKTEFDEMLRYFSTRLAEERVDIRLRCAPTADELLAAGFDEIVIATGVVPRRPDIPGIDHPKVLDYAQVLVQGAPVGHRVAIIGAGGIGFDMAEFLLGGPPHVPPAMAEFAREYPLDLTCRAPGGLRPATPPVPTRREVTLLQRSTRRFGAALAPSTGWIRRDRIKRQGVQCIGGLTYRHIDDQGLHYAIDGTPHTLAVDTIILCAGQDPDRRLHAALQARKPTMPVHMIGGADVAVELDAVRAIDQGTRLALRI